MKATVFIHEDKPDRNGNQVDIEGLLFPETVPLRINFNGERIGKAHLKREGDRIVAELPGDLDPALVPAVGFRILQSDIDYPCLLVRKAEILEVSLCKENADPRIPPLGGTS